MKYYLMSENNDIVIYKKHWSGIECKIRSFKSKQLNLAIRYMNYINEL